MPTMHPSTDYRNTWQRVCLVAICVTLLSWVPFVSADRTAGEYYVSSLPGAPKGPLLKMHAGHIEVDEASNGHLFFWHFQNRHLADRHRTVIWINGGPGCSSEDGALMEVGPYRVREGGQLEYNNGSWDEFANLLFVDNPVGTGFSYVDTNSYIHELDTMANHFVKFLESFFDIFPEYSNDDLYIAGESYAGMHIPYIAQHILDRNKNSPSQWNLKGLLIGNGWTSPIDQYPSYLQMAYKSGIIQRGSASAKKVESQQAVCEKILAEDGGDEHVDISACEAILQDILSVTRDKSAADDQQCINMYDLRLRDSYPSCGMSWPPDLKDVTPYLRQKDVVEALHIDSAKQSGWSECSGAVGSAFSARNSTPAVHLLPNLLAQMPIVLFSGDKDMICNHLGTETLIHNLEWNGGKGFETAPGTIAARRDWTFEGEPAGIYQYARNLTYVLFYNSSHMVPFDYPRRTRDMLDRFMNVDIATIGGDPYDSRIDGEKGQTTSVGAHPNSTQAEIESEEALNQAAWDAYYRSGEAVLVIVAIAAACWGWFVYRDRRRRAGYKGLSGAPGGMLEGLSPGGYRSNASLNVNPNGGRRDLEAADFDEAELDDLVPTVKKGYDGRGGGTYALGSDSEDEDDGRRGKQANGAKKE